MRWVTFDEVSHHDYRDQVPYRLDFGTNEARKYKTLMDGVRVYECGIIRVEKSGIREPGWRSEVGRTLGLLFLLPAEMTGYRFFDPDNGKLVPKSVLPAVPLFYDEGRGRVHVLGWGTGNKCMEFVSEHAQPSFSGAGVFKYMTPNKERFKARMEELEEYINIGAALNSLDGGTTPVSGFTGYHGLSHATKNTLNTGGVPTGGMADTGRNMQCQELARAPKEVARLVKLATQDVFKPKFLLARRQG